MEYPPGDRTLPASGSGGAYIRAFWGGIPARYRRLVPLARPGVADTIRICSRKAGETDGEGGLAGPRGEPVHRDGVGVPARWVAVHRSDRERVRCPAHYPARTPADMA